MNDKSKQEMSGYQSYLIQDNLKYFKPHKTSVTVTFAEELRKTLQEPKKSISPKFFYDENGSKLFDEICSLPEYYPYNSETEILQTLEKKLLPYLSNEFHLVELGSGSSVKTRLLIDILFKSQTHLQYFPIDISEILIGKSDQKLSGTAICASVEGTRPFLVEVQALVSSAVYGTPQRSSTGINSKRLNMLLAVLEKRAGFHLGSKDIFINITGGLKVEDTGNDLAIISAIMSSNNDISIPEEYCFAAEVGLSGEIRPVSRIDQRIKEAEKLGFSKIFVSKYCDVISSKKIEVVYLTRIEDLIDHIS